MSIVKINALVVPEQNGEEFLRRFAARPGTVDDAEGFEGFDVLRPTDERDTWLVVTRWRDEACYEAWLAARPPRGSHEAGLSTEWQVWSFERVDGSCGR